MLKMLKHDPYKTSSPSPCYTWPDAKKIKIKHTHTHSRVSFWTVMVQKEIFCLFQYLTFPASKEMGVFIFEEYLFTRLF